MKERICFLATHFYTLKFFGDFVDAFGQNGNAYYDWIKWTFISDIGKKNKSGIIIYKEKRCTGKQ